MPSILEPERQQTLHGLFVDYPPWLVQLLHRRLRHGGDAQEPDRAIVVVESITLNQDGGHLAKAGQQSRRVQAANYRRERRLTR